MINSNINRHRSPMQKNLPQISSKGLNFLNTNSQSAKLLKNDMHSSTQQSTKQQHSSRQVQNNMRDSQYVSPPNLAFFKVKKQQLVHAKSQQNLLTLKTHNSEKTLHINKFDSKNDAKNKKSPEKFQDYFGFKNAAQKNIKHKQQISDSGDSQMSRNSVQSNNADLKPIKFFNKKLQKKCSEEQLVRPQRHKALNNETERHVPLFLQQRVQQQKKINITKNEIIKLTPKKLSPQHGQTISSPNKKIQNSIQGNNNNNNKFKRTSLTPQNKLQLNLNSNHETSKIVVKPSLTPRKVSMFNENDRQSTPPKYLLNNLKQSKLNSFYPQNKQKKQHNSDFSFSKQQLSRAQLQNNNTSISGGNNKLNRSMLSLPIITIFPISLQNSAYPVSFILLQKLAENRSSSIYKIIHPNSSVIYCLKKCAVQRGNLQQLITEHKISMHMTHCNLVKSYASFYDRSNLYLLMEYMQGRSLCKSNRLKPIKDKFQQTGWQVNSQSASNTNISRLSFRQKPKLQHLDAQIRYSNMMPNSLQRNRGNRGQKLSFIKNVLQQILQGLVYLHEHNIIHRDLKPDNIFVSHLNYKIGDFGSCTYKNSQQYVGTLDYAAPEIMMQQNYDRSVDLWSLGCIAYQLDVGSPPFYHYDRAQTIRKITAVQYDDELISDENLRRFISKLLLRQGHLRIDANQALMEIKMLQFKVFTKQPPINFYSSAFGSSFNFRNK